MSSPGRREAGVGSRQSRLGVLGGMFDPIHLGHLTAALKVQEALALDRMVLVPSRQPPHRQELPQASGEDRLAMAKLACREHPSWSVSDAELTREGHSYTFDTLTQILKRGLAAFSVFFITGADAFAEIATWSRYPAVLDLANFVVVARPGTTLAIMRKRLPDLADRMVSSENFVPVSRLPTPDSRVPATSIVLLETATPDVSSTEIRRRAQAGRPLTGLVPPAVASYIASKHLYVGSGL